MPPSTSAHALESGVFTLMIVSVISVVVGTEWGGLSTEDKLACPVFKLGKNAELILIQKALTQNDDFLPPVMIKHN